MEYQTIWPVFLSKAMDPCLNSISQQNGRYTSDIDLSDLLPEIYTVHIFSSRQSVVRRAEKEYHESITGNVVSK